MVASRIITGGASMGGYSALLYSIFLEAEECYASCPQTSLNPDAWYYSIDEDFNRISETSRIKPWSKGYLKSLGINDMLSYEKIRSRYPFVDLPHFFRRLSSELSLKLSFINDNLNFEELVTKFPSAYYHITSCRYDHPKDYNSSYQSEFIQPLMSAMVDSGIHYSQLTLPFPGHDHFHGPSVIAVYSSRYQEFVNLRISAEQNIGHELDRYSASYLRKEKQFINAMHLLL